LKRPTFDQILDWKQRRGPQSGPAYDVRRRIEELKRAWEETPQSYLMEFIPMRIATCVEVYSREIIRELVDTDEKYVDSATELVKNAKFDLVFAAHLAGKKLSIGDFVAHTVSINSVDAVISVVSKLIPDFTQKMKNSHARWLEDESVWPLPPIISDYDDTIKTLSNMFEIRHILTHELPTNQVIEESDISKMCVAAINFVDACDWVIVAEVLGSIPRTQTAMNFAAGDKCEEASLIMKDTLIKVAKLPNIDTKLLLETQEKWLDFSKQEASLIANQVEGGSMYSMLWNSAKESLIRDRTVQLKQLAEDWMDKSS
jgi:hypothetical protein